MIQIQDDAINQSTSFSTAPDSSIPPASSPVQPVSPTPSVAPPLPSVPAADTEKTSKQDAEIDKLLAELDTLSNNLNKKDAVVSATPAAPVPPMVSNDTETSKGDDVIEPRVQSNKSTDDQKLPASDKNFDFDTFLTDLENKIDKESTKNKSGSDAVSAKITANQSQVDHSSKEELPQIAFEDGSLPTDDQIKTEDQADSEEDETTADFRQNRVTPSVDEINTTDTQPTADLADITDMISDQPQKVATEDEAIQPETATDEDLKSQNIFEMLGITNISDEEKNKFLDELESMIWDDFILHDLELLLSSEEYQAARQILDETNKDNNAKKEALITYLEKLIPDLDEVLYDKALEMKSEMMGERLKKMKENADPATMEQIKKAEDLIGQNRWKSAVTALNQ